MCVDVCLSVCVCQCVCVKVSKKDSKRYRVIQLDRQVLSYSALNHIPPTPAHPNHLFKADFGLMEVIAWVHEFIH